MYLTENETEKDLKQETISTMEKELESLSQRKIELTTYIIKLKRIDENKENLHKFIESYRKNFDNLDSENKIELIKEFVEKVMVYEN